MLWSPRSDHSRALKKKKLCKSPPNLSSPTNLCPGAAPTVASPFPPVMQATDNCTTSLPVSSEYFSHITAAERVIIGITTTVCLLVIALFFNQMNFILSNYQDKEIMSRTLWVIGIYPTVSTAAVFIVYVPRLALLARQVASIYFAVSKVYFGSLVMLYAGGSEMFMQKAKELSFNLRTPPCCCCWPCLPQININWTNLRILQAMVLQQPFLLSFTTFLALAFWVDGDYVDQKLGYDQISTYVLFVETVSTLIALYGLVILLRTLRHLLKKEQIFAKFLTLQLVLVALRFQGSVFFFLAANNLPPCSTILPSRVRGGVILQGLLVVEMLLLSGVSSFLYCRDQSDEDKFSSSDLEEESVSIN